MVHVWRAHLDLDTKRLRRLEGSLSTDEQTRAAGFRFARDRKRLIAARGVLREVLALYLDTEPRRLVFSYGPYGKPFLADAVQSALRFNVSHSLDTMLIAVSNEREVGVDIQYAGTDIRLEEIAAATLSEAETEVLSRVHGEARRTAALRLFARKEAYIKADGRGMSLPLRQIDVSHPAGKIAVLDEKTGHWEVCTRLVLQSLAVGPAYVAALAAEGPESWPLACWRWEG